MVSGLQVWRWRVYSVAGLGRSTGSNPVLYKRVWAGSSLGLSGGLVLLCLDLIGF